MDSSNFLQLARELTETLEMFQITFARYCAVTWYAGDGISIDYDRSDRFAAALHRKMLKIFPSDSFVVSYDPLETLYEDLEGVKDDVLSDEGSLRSACVNFRDMLLSKTGDTSFRDSVNKEYHVVYTESYGVCVSAKDMDSLENYVLRTEEYIRIISKHIKAKKDIISKAGERTDKVCERHRIMSEGLSYLGQNINSKR